jgi:hypothetical protein
VISIERRQVFDHEKQYQAAGDAQRKTGNIKERAPFCAHEIAHRGFEIVLEHTKFLTRVFTLSIAVPSCKSAVWLQ